LRFTDSLILFGIRKNCLISGKSLLFYQSTKRVIKLTVQLSCDVTAIIFIQNCIQYHSLKIKLLLIISVGFDVTDQLLIRYFAVQYFHRVWGTHEATQAD
jgi:hypothetical protein